MSTHHDVDALIVGAGVVGLAIAAELSQSLRRVVVVERRSSFGLEVSSRSSEVVHSGLYYNPGSYKAKMCIEGAALVFERCRRFDIPLQKRGKLVLAQTSAQEQALIELKANAEACGARDLEMWSQGRLGTREPRVNAVAALHSPWTAVVDSHELVRSFAFESRQRGVDIAFKHTLQGLEQIDRGWTAALTDPGGELITTEAPIVINAAGLGSDAVAAMAGIDVDMAGYRLFLCKGDYFALSNRTSRGLERLLYPLPDPNLRGLGVHLTIDVAGQARLGPDATYLSNRVLSYAVDEDKRRDFLAAGQRLLPELRKKDLSPDRSGIRPKLSGPGEPPRDFVICHESDRGLRGLVNLIGIESPGLTAAPAIAHEVARVLRYDGMM